MTDITNTEEFEQIPEELIDRIQAIRDKATENIHKEAEQNAIDGDYIPVNQRQRIFTSLQDMLSYIQVFKIESASFQSGYQRMEDGSTGSKKIYQITHHCVND